jgi:hypothetical protein
LDLTISRALLHGTSRTKFTFVNGLIHVLCTFVLYCSANALVVVVVVVVFVCVCVCVCFGEGGGGLFQLLINNYCWILFLTALLVI